MTEQEQFNQDLADQVFKPYKDKKEAEIKEDKTAIIKSIKTITNELINLSEKLEKLWGISKT